MNNMNKITTKVEEVEKRLQFTIVLAMFFPVLLETFLNLGGTQTEILSRTMLAISGVSIGSLVLNYVVFEWRKDKLADRVLDYLNWTFFTIIICYVCIFLSLSSISTAITIVESRFAYTVFSTAFRGALYIPMIILAILILDFFIKKSKTT